MSIYHTASGILTGKCKTEVSSDRTCLRLTTVLTQAVVNGRVLKNPLPCLFFNEQAEMLLKRMQAGDLRPGERIWVQGRHLKTSYLIKKCDTRKEEYYLWVYRFEKIGGEE